MENMAEIYHNILVIFSVSTCIFCGKIVILALISTILIRWLSKIYCYKKGSNFILKGGRNKWIVITGATEGIGLEFAKQLFMRGYNLLLISRNEEKLKKVKNDIILMRVMDRYVRTLVIDFTADSEEIYRLIKSELDSLESINIIINNVSICYPDSILKKFLEIENLNNFISDLVKANIVSSTILTLMGLKYMHKKKRGMIINLSSISCLFPVTYLSFYSSSKLFVETFTRSLQEEYRFSGVTINSLIPGYVSTKMAHYKMPSVLSACSTTEQYVRSVLTHIGHTNRTTGWKGHKLWFLLIYVLNILSLIVSVNLNAIYHQRTLKNIKEKIEIKSVEKI